MLKEIILEDFFSFKGYNSIKLNPGVNLLLGINGSGKTSFLNALRLLYEGVAGRGFDSLFQKQWGGFGQVINANGENADVIQLTYVFDASVLKQINPSSPFGTDVFYRISIYPLGGTDYVLREKLYTQSHTDANKIFVYLEFINGKGRISTWNKKGEVEFNLYDAGEVSGRELVLRQITDPSRFMPSHTLRRAIEGMGIYDCFDTASDSKIRKPSEYSNLNKLSCSGDNLPHLLNNLKNNKTFIFDKIEKLLTRINPNYESIAFNYFGSQLYLSLKEKNLNKTIGASHISDGTLRFLLYMVMLYNPDRGSLLGIDEPESGLHPDMIRTVANAVKEASLKTQMIIATHSPLLLNCFELDDLLIFEKDGELNHTTVKQMDEDEFEEWEGEFLPGQMWLRGQIGGKRW